MSYPANPGLAPERPEPVVMIHQIARHWRDWTRWVSAPGAPVGFTLAEPLSPAGVAVSANVYAGVPLPPLASRAETACSLTIGAEQGPEAGSPRTRIVVLAEAHDTLRRGAARLLNDLRALLLAGERPWCHRPLYSGIQVPDLGGLCGVPPFEYFPDNSHALLWRIRGVEIVAEVQPLAIEAGPSATPEGQGSAQLTFALWGVPDSLPAPVPHLVIAHDGSGGVTEATVRVLPSPLSTLTLGRQVGAAAPVVNTIDLATVGTLTQLITAVNAVGNGWSAAAPGVPDPGASLARPAIDLEPRSATSALGDGVTLRAWA